MENAELPMADPNFWREVILTHREQVSEGLHHHFSVQGPLSRVQALPLLGSEFNGHIFECQPSLKQKHISPMGPPGESSFHTK